MSAKKAKLKRRLSVGAKASKSQLEIVTAAASHSAYSQSASFKKSTDTPDEATPSTKGVYDGICYRTACDSRQAIWYNHSTRRYYCTACARLINEHNHHDAQRLYGHELCTIGKYKPVDADA